MQRVALAHLASTTSPIHPAPSAETSRILLQRSSPSSSKNASSVLVSRPALAQTRCPVSWSTMTTRYLWPFQGSVMRIICLEQAGHVAHR